MNNHPAISVIMPCYNESKHILRAVESVFHQTFADFELIVVDDGSTDNSSVILDPLLHSHANLRLIRQPNSGAATARNNGIQNANGEMIAFLDADDTWHSRCLEKLYAALASEPDAAIAYCGWQNIGLSKNRSKPYIPPDYEQPDKVETLLRGCRWPIHAALVRRIFLDNSGGFNTSLGSCEDFDLWLRIGSFNKIVLVPEVLAFYQHNQGTQTTSNRLKIALDHALVQRIFFKSNRDIKSNFGRRKVRDIIEGELLHRAYVSYWERDLKTAHALFRKVFFRLFFNISDLRYIIPSLLPFFLFRRLVHLFEK